ncbi:MAG TPA: hypothetical protein DCS82_05130 [Rhodospirillaceae bacterium]|nr:hypothetical protein [Rhodospirillaceae bacterium]HAA91497.1 hypothetical protein [Rhodospirillaceae bacterium]HAT35079.1 hypothetical protein [Rhodospirillaceae bacterium]|tara:strand:+ start:186 stop:416 length:231 start_codon:yes stop_codon:yes gene_type:complete
MNSSPLEKAKSLLSTVLEIPTEEISDDAGIETLERWDSLGHVKIILQLEQTLGNQLDPEEISELNDVAAIAKLLQP